MRTIAAFLISTAALLGGCAAGGAEFEPALERVVEAPPEEVLAQAAAVLRREFGRARVDSDARRVTTEPVEYRTTSDSGAARDLYGGRSTMRRIATFNVGRRGAATVARLRIDVERRETSASTSLSPGVNRLGDSPGTETAIDRDAATSERQNSSWVRVRRDRALERRLLDELREHFAPPQPEKPE